MEREAQKRQELSLAIDPYCRYIKGGGLRCKRKVRTGQTRCWQHTKGLRKRWHALTRNQTLAFLLTLFFGVAGILLPFFPWNNTSAKELQGGLTPAVRPVVNEMLNAYEASLRPGDRSRENPVRDMLNQKLQQDPYDVPDLVLRGQLADADGGRGFRNALADFERAAEANKQLSDPHFGIGTFLYHLAVFDLIHRGRYRIVRKGTFAADPAYWVAPEVEVFPDERTRPILQAALEEFEKGNTLRQLSARVPVGSKPLTALYYHPAFVSRNIQSLREMLQYSPKLTSSDQDLSEAVTIYFNNVSPHGFYDLYDFSSGPAKNGHQAKQ